MRLDIYLSSEGGDLLYHATAPGSAERMAEAAGLHKLLWRHDGDGTAKAVEFIAGLASALNDLSRKPSKYKDLEAQGGATWNQFLPWVAEVLEACKDNPRALVKVSCF